MPDKSRIQLPNPNLIPTRKHNQWQEAAKSRTIKSR